MNERRFAAILFLQVSGVLDFIEECGDVLHCQSEANTIADIDDYIANHREAVRGK